MTNLKLLTGLVLVSMSLGHVSAAELQIDKSAIINGRLVITGRTSLPSQVVELVDTAEKTASLPSRRFRLDLVYLPATCIIKLKAGIDETIEGIVSGCAPRGKDGKDGKDGLDEKSGLDGKDGAAGKDGQKGKDGKDGRDGITYGSLPGDGGAFQCWASDLIGLWFIEDYPGPNRKTIAHISPGRADGSDKLNVTDPSDPLRSARPDGRDTTALVQLSDAELNILRQGGDVAELQGDLASDCRSIVWTNQHGDALATWKRD